MPLTTTAGEQEKFELQDSAARQGGSQHQLWTKKWHLVDWARNLRRATPSRQIFLRLFPNRSPVGSAGRIRRRKLGLWSGRIGSDGFVLGKSKNHSTMKHIYNTAAIALLASLV